MSQIVEFPDRGLVAEEAAEWLIRLDADRAPTDEERRALGEWMHRSPVHREELQNLAALWGRMNVLTELSVPLAGASRPERASRKSWLIAVAAVAVVAIATSLLISRPATDSSSPINGSPSNGSLSNGLYATAVGQQRTQTLADGSRVFLNTNSQIKVEFGAAERTIYLMQGEALFTVTKNRRWPFRVFAGNHLIEAVGTSFSVHLKGDELNVAVTEGRVALASVGLEAEVALDGASNHERTVRRSLGALDAGQAVTIHPMVEQSASGSDERRDVIEPVAPAEMAKRLAWREGVVMFSGERLEEVVAELSRYTTLTIEIPDASVRDMRIGGRFPIGETETMLAAFQTNLNLRVTRIDHDRVVLSASPH